MFSLLVLLLCGRVHSRGTGTPLLPPTGRGPQSRIRVCSDLVLHHPTGQLGCACGPVRGRACLCLRGPGVRGWALLFLREPNLLVQCLCEPVPAGSGAWDQWGAQGGCWRRAAPADVWVALPRLLFRLRGAQEPAFTANPVAGLWEPRSGPPDFPPPTLCPLDGGRGYLRIHITPSLFSLPL